MLLRVFLFTVFSFLCICSSMKHASLCTHHHITIFIFLHIHKILNQDLFSAKSCLMSFVKPSHTFKLKSILDSSVTICLDKVVYFTFEQTPENWAIHFTLLGKELPQQNMLIKKKILILKFTSDSWGGENEPWQKPTNSLWKLKNYFEPWNTAWFSRLFTYTLLTKAKINVAGYWPILVVVVVCTEWSLIVIIWCF